MAGDQTVGMSPDRRLATLRRCAAVLLVSVALVSGGPGADAQESDGPPPEVVPGYEEQIMRLSEILGALHFFREICGHGDASSWRAEMETLLEAEAPGPDRRGRMIARFNHGFETVNAVYRHCTPAAESLVARYLDEGRKISDDIRLRYSQ